MVVSHFVWQQRSLNKNHRVDPARYTYTNQVSPSFCVEEVVFGCRAKLCFQVKHFNFFLFEEETST